MTKRWGPWRLSNDGQFLEYRWDESVHDSALYRKLNLYRCTTAAEVLDTIFHEAGAGVAETDDAYLAGLVRALDDLLHPVANLCSGGKATTLSRAELVEILGGQLSRPPAGARSDSRTPSRHPGCKSAHPPAATGTESAPGRPGNPH